MQETIDKIIDFRLDKGEKLVMLKKLFGDGKKYVFVDFDDTITADNCLFFSKFKFLSKYKKMNVDEIYELLAPEFSLHQNFLKTISGLEYDALVVLSRNNHGFLKKFIPLLRENNVNIGFVIGNTDAFKTSSFDKLFIVSNSTIISDIFEYNKLKNYKNFLCVDDYSFLKLFTGYLKKIHFYFGFVIKNV